MDVQPFKIQETVSKYSPSLDTLQPCMLSDPEFNTPLGSCQDGKRLHLGTDKVKSLLSMALLPTVIFFNPQVSPILICLVPRRQIKTGWPREEHGHS